MAKTSFLSPKLETLIKSALAGDTYAQNRLGDLYREGDDVEQNYSEALKWYQHAADEGDPSGQNNVGSMYLNGLGAEPNPEKAAQYFRLAAEQDLTVAQYNLGVRYRDGDGVPIDLSEAAVWLERAAEAGDAYVQNDWGVMLRFGNGVEKDILNAAYWFLEAIKQDDVVALGNFYGIVEELKPLAKAGQEQAQLYLTIFDIIQEKVNADKATWPAWIPDLDLPAIHKKTQKKGASNE